MGSAAALALFIATQRTMLPHPATVVTIPANEVVIFERHLHTGPHIAISIFCIFVVWPDLTLQSFHVRLPDTG